MNGHLGLIHSILPATVDLHVSIPETHPSARNLGSERVGSGTIVDPDGYKSYVAERERAFRSELQKQQRTVR